MTATRGAVWRPVGFEQLDSWAPMTMAFERPTGAPGRSFGMPARCGWGRISPTTPASWSHALREGYGPGR